MQAICWKRRSAASRANAIYAKVLSGQAAAKGASNGTFRVGEAGEGDVLPLMLSVLESCGLVAAELVGPDVLFSCKVSKCEAHVYGLTMRQLFAEKC